MSSCPSIHFLFRAAQKFLQRVSDHSGWGIKKAYALVVVLDLLKKIKQNKGNVSSVQFSSFAPSCPTVYNTMDCSTTGLPIHHQLLEFTQTHVHWVGDAIQPSHPQSPLLLLPSIFPSIRVFSNESFFASGGQSIGVSASTSVLPMNIQDWLPLGRAGQISWDSQEYSPSPEFKSINSLVFSFLCSPTLTFICDYWKNHSFD